MLQNSTAPLKILLADDDKDDRFLFGIALKKIPITVNLNTVENGQKLMEYLLNSLDNLPDVLFLDLNMPLKNGNECLAEIKANKKINQIPVVIYSTSLRDEIADILYHNGAHYYLQKTDLTSLSLPLEKVLTWVKQKNNARPSRENFILNSNSNKYTNYF